METTTNYNLKKYQSGDLFNPLTVNNPNLDDIDTDMKAISDRAIGRATELVSQGVHAITLIDTDCKTFKFVATGNYSAGETFTVNGIQCNAYTPSGSALTSNAFVTGSIVIGSLNEDGTAITFYVTGSAVADDSLKLGGELPSYYATQSDMTNANTDITNLKNQNGNTSIAGIGDGTLSGAVSQLNNDLTEKGLYLLASNLTTVNTYTLNDSLSKFDAILFIGQRIGFDDLGSSLLAPLVDFNDGTVYMVNTNDRAENYFANIQYVDNTHIKIVSVSAGSFKIKNVYGVKY